jgi:hypothetical protein
MVSRPFPTAIPPPPVTSTIGCETPHDFYSLPVVIFLWLVPSGVYSFQAADTRTLHGSALCRTLSVA